MAGEMVLAGVTVDGTMVGAYTPAWLSAAGVGVWTAIAGTTCPWNFNHYSGAAWREQSDLVECAQLASGGHGDNPSQNRVETLRLDVESPAWVQRRADSSTAGWDTTGATGGGYMPDGRPAPRHTYGNNWWVPEQNRYMMMGAQYVGTSVFQYPNHDAFDPDANDWDAALTYPDLSSTALWSARDPLTGILYGTQGSLTSYNPTANTFGNVGFTGSGTVNRSGTAFDTLRGKLYHLSSGDNYSGGSSTIASTQITTAGVKTPITFNSSSAYTAFVAAAPSFLGTELVYDNDLDVFYFYAGGNGAGLDRKSVYRITPNAGTTWDMDLITVTGVTPPDTTGSGVYTKFKYISRFKAIFLIVGSANVHFLRTQ